MLSGEFAGAQSVVCLITGEVEDKTERQVILYDILADSRRFELDERKPTNECIVVEVKDGRFMYNLKTDGLRCYQIETSAKPTILSTLTHTLLEE